MKKLMILTSILCINAAYAASPVYKCDVNGVITYTSSPCKDKGEKLSLPEISITNNFKNSGSSNATSGATQSKSSDGQKVRESKRQEILQDELKKEEQALTSAEKALNEQKEVRSGDEKNYQRVLDRLKPFEDEVVLRKKNIDAIKKEIDTSR